MEEGQETEGQRETPESDEEGGTRKDRETSAEGGDESERVNQQETKEREGGGINHRRPWFCNIEKSQWPGTKLSTHTLLLTSSPTSLSVPPKLPLLSPPSSATLSRFLPPSLLTTPYIFQRFNTVPHFSSGWEVLTYTQINRNTPLRAIRGKHKPISRL